MIGRPSIDPTGKRSVIMFAYYFPPCVCWPTASARAEGLAAGLTEHGWAPIVVLGRMGVGAWAGTDLDRRFPVR